MGDWRLRAVGHALVAGVLLPVGVAAVAVGLLRLAGVGFSVIDDIRIASSGSAGRVVALFVLGGGLSWVGLHEARHCFAIVHQSKDR